MTRSLPFVPAALALGLGLAPAVSLAQEPPAMFRGGPQHSGVTDTRGLERLRRLVWRFETDGPVRSSPVVVDETVYFGSADGHLYAVDAATGALRWRRDAGAPVNGAPLATEELVVFVDRANRIYGLRRETGTVRWMQQGHEDLPLVWGWEGWDYLTASPTLAGDVVLAGTGDGFLYAMDLETGDERWRFRTGGRIRSAPAVHDGVVYVGAGDGVVYGLTLGAGVQVWRFETRGAGLRAVDFGFDRTQIYSSPAVADGVLYLGSRDASLYALDLATGGVRWTFEDGTAWVIASPAVHLGTVYSARSSSGKVRALDAATGGELWSFQTGGLVFSSPVVAEGAVYVGSGDGRIYAFDASTGEQRWLYQTDGGVMSTPAVWERMLYVGSDDGYLYALQGTLAHQPRLAVYWDDSLMSRAIWGRTEDHRRPADYFRDLGYEQLDGAGLQAFLSQRVDDAVPSVVVIAMDALPASVTDRGRRSLLRRYLERGGKVVWMGFPPLIITRDPETGEVTGTDRQRPTDLLGVDFGAWNSDEYGVTPTPEGRAWGLETRGVGMPAVRADQDVTPLALDELGRAALWVKEYGGDPGTGFVFVRLGTDRPYLDELRRVAEYGVVRSREAAAR